MTDTGRGCFVAVHAGAGYHSTDKEKEYKTACITACKKAMAKLKNGTSALEAIRIAIQSLEDSEVTNAGKGSNLTIDGTVECDASIMDGKTLLFGGVGALSNVKNPIQVAENLVEEQKHGTLPLGRIPPCMMVGEGAQSWAKQHGVEVVSCSSMKTASSVKVFESHKRRLENYEERRKAKRRKHLEHQHADRIFEGDFCIENEGIQDTVGAVCIDTQGNMAAGASSGGISLKQIGRLGPAALYGAGCWAYNWKAEKKPGVAIATSGTGEHIIKTLLAKTCADSLQRETSPLEAIQDTIQEHFLDSDYLDHSKERYGGVLALKHEKHDPDCETVLPLTTLKEETSENIVGKGENAVELLWGHTTDSMCIGYVTSCSKPKAVISRLGDDVKAGHTYLLQGHHFCL